MARSSPGPWSLGLDRVATVIPARSGPMPRRRRAEHESPTIRLLPSVLLRVTGLDALTRKDGKSTIRCVSPTHDSALG